MSQVNYHRAEEEFRRKRTWLNRTAIGQKWLQRSSGASRPLSNAEAAILRFKVYSSLSSVDYDAAWLITRRILERLKSDASRHEAEILIMTVPALIETDEGYRTKGLAELKTSSDEIGKDIPQKRLGKIAKELQIPFLDLTADFREQEAEPGTQLFRGYDLHWNAQGHRLAASRVVDRIRRDFLADVR